MTEENGYKQTVLSDNLNTTEEAEASAYVPPHLRGSNSGNGRRSRSPAPRDRGRNERSYGGRDDRDGGYGRRGDSRGGYNRGSSRDRREPTSVGGKWKDPEGGFNREDYSRSDRGGDRGRDREDRGRSYNSRGRGPEIDPFKAEAKDLFDSGSNTGINFDSYDDIPVEATGEDIPDALETFEEAKLISLVMDNIKRAKYEKPTPVQKNAIPYIIAGRDVMACAQTGSGKTAAFLLPMISGLYKDAPPEKVPRGRGRRKAYPASLIIAPTRELAKQIHKETIKFSYKTGMHAVCVYGGADFHSQVRELERGCEILIATPGRLVDMIERGRISVERVRYLTLDEADRMLDMGFEPQIRRIVEEEGMPDIDGRLTMMFSATWPSDIQRLAADFLDNYIFLRVGRVNSTTDFICQKVIPVEEHAKEETLLELLQTVKGLTLVFVETKRSADMLDNSLYDRGFPSTSIHGDRSQREREAALLSFKRGKTPILVATDVAARGLDIPNVLHVINYDMPNNIESYIHRIGRTGRAGNSGLATAFVNQGNGNVIPDLLVALRDHDQEVPGWLEDLERTSRYGNKGRGGYRGKKFGGRDFRRNGGGGGGKRSGGGGGGYSNSRSGGGYGGRF
eukprot:TRINITY_DN75_c0_g1_i1.p1 TRINITY_DN75_c0_g1~~TRINITY_DN75_c0_g1_i1.p1  ORF type:complete len:622 (-),score=120.37 TRINITY_DN75_c0_g1_i1:119-1984(-)